MVIQFDCCTVICEREREKEKERERERNANSNSCAIERFRIVNFDSLDFCFAVLGFPCGMD